MKRLLSLIGEWEYRVTILIATFLTSAPKADAQMTSFGIDTDGDGVVNARVWPYDLTSSDSTITFTVTGKMVDLSSAAAGGIYLDTTTPSDGVYDVLMSPAYFRPGLNIKSYISSGFWMLDASADADSLLGAPVDSTGKGQDYVITWDTASGGSWKVQPVTAGDAYFFKGAALGDTTGIADWDVWRYNAATGQWILDQPPGITSGTQDSAAIDTTGDKIPESYAFPLILSQGDNIDIHKYGDTVVFSGSLGLIDTLATRDSIYYRSTVTGDTLWKAKNNNATAQTTFSTDSRQTGGIRWNGLAILDANINGLDISDEDAGLNRTGIQFLDDNMYISTRNIQGWANVFQFYGTSMIGVHSSAAISGTVEWDGNRFDNNELDTVAAMAGLFYKYCTDVADSALVTLLYTKLLLEDTLDEYPDTVMLNDSCQDAEADARAAVRDTVQGPEFRAFASDSITADTIAFKQILKGIGSGSFCLTGSGSSSGNFYIAALPAAGTPDTIFMPTTTTGVDSTYYWCYGTNGHTQWRVPPGFNWADSAGEPPFWVDSATYASELDTTAAAFQAYVGNHGAGGFWDTVATTDRIFVVEAGGDTTFMIIDSAGMTYLRPYDRDTLVIGDDAGQVRIGGEGITEADSLTIFGVCRVAGRFGLLISGDTVWFPRTKGADAYLLELDTVAGAADSLKWVAAPAASVGAQSITKEHIDSTASNVVFDDAYRGTSAVDDSAYGTEYYARKVAGDSAGTRTLSTDFAKVTDDTTTWNAKIGSTDFGKVTDDTTSWNAKIGATDFGKVTDDTTAWNGLVARRSEKTFSLVDPANFGCDTVTVWKIPADVYPNGITLRVLSFWSETSVTDTVTLNEWSDAVGTSAALLNEMILAAGTELVDSTLTDSVMAAGSRLVFKSVKAGNAEKNAGVTITYTVR